MAMFRKKPVEIEAREFGSGFEFRDQIAADIAHWCGGTIVDDDTGWHMLIPTLEGTHRADPGDWIIRGVAGEFYPCKPRIFEATYEAVE